MTFKPHEIDFMRGTDLGRLATVQPNGTLQNSPVGYTYNDDLGTIDIAGYRMSKSQKYRNVANNPKVAFVVDDIASTRPVAGALPGDPRHCRAGRRPAATAPRATNSTRRSSGSRRDESSASASTTPTPSRTCSTADIRDV